MIYRNNKGITFVEIIISAAILSIIIMGSAQAIKYVMHAMAKDRQEIQANNFSQVIIEELKVNCVPELFLDLGENFNTNDWEEGQPRRFPNLRGDVDIQDPLPNGQSIVAITISHENSDKTFEYQIILVKNTGLIPRGVVSGRVVNYVTDRGIPGAEVEAPGAKTDGSDASTTTRADGSFTLTNVKVGPDTLVTIFKMGSVPNDMNYDPQYYFDPEMINMTDPDWLPYDPPVYENTSTSGDKLQWTKEFNVQNNIVTDIGTVYLCPMGIVRGWVREDENDSATGVGRIVMEINKAANFSTKEISETYRNSMHPYYGAHGLTIDDNGCSGVFYVTTSTRAYSRTYSVEDVDITLNLEIGEYVFFNIRPGVNRRLRALGRRGSDPTVQQGEPDFSWGYLKSSYDRPRYPSIIVTTENCFDTTGANGSTGIGPYINRAEGFHNRLPVAESVDPLVPGSGYKYYYYGICTHTCDEVNFNPFARADVITSLDMFGTHSGCEDFTQNGWHNYESIGYHYEAGYADARQYPTCFVARKRGGIKGKIIDVQTGSDIEGIFVRAKVWADTNNALSWAWTDTFGDSCPEVTTNSDGEFFLYNLYGKEQQYYATSGIQLPNWNPHIDALKTACENDTSVQNYAVLRITDEADGIYVPRLIRPYRDGVPFPSWHPDNNWNGLETDDHGITDFGDIQLINVNTAVIVTGRLVDSDGNPIDGGTIATRGIRGLAVDEGDNTTLLDMNHAASIVTFTTGADGIFTLTGVMPNYVPLTDNTTDVRHSLVVHPRGSVRRFITHGPDIEYLNNITLTGRVTDYITAGGVDNAEVWLMAETSVAGQYVNQQQLATTGGDGYYSFFGSINGIAGEDGTYFEHLPSTTTDLYVNPPATPPNITNWDDTAFIADRTIDIGDIPVGIQDNQRDIVIGARRTGSYEEANTFEIYGDNGIYTVMNNTTINNITLSLLKIYQISYFGRVVDGEDNPVENGEIYVASQDSVGTNHGGWLGDTYKTDSEGYWGDWTPAGFSGRGTAEVISSIYPLGRGTADAGMPRWYVDIRASEEDDTAHSQLFEIRLEPTIAGTDGATPWHNGSKVEWQDGYAVHIDTITLPIFYADGQ